MHNLYTSAGYPDPPGTMEEEEDEEDDDYENMAPPYKDLPPKPGTMEEEEDDDYENSAPPYKDLPPKPGSIAPPRPPRAGLDLAAVTCIPPQLGEQWEDPSRSLRAVDLEPSPLQPPLAAAPARWLSQTSGGPGCCQKRLIVCLCLLVATSLILSCFGLILTLTKYEELVKELRMLSFQQMMWRANVTGMAGLAGLKHDIDRVRADTNQSLVELWGLLDCSRVTCPEGWLPFESKCYYFSPTTKSWDGARMFCQENYSHLVIINSFAEHNFVAKAHGSPRVYWLGLNDREQEGNWRWLDGSPVTLSFWEPEEPNNIQEEDCASMNKDGTWNDLSCHKSTYWICERKCSC
ncbi:C-type lectin domain family 17, member A isoform X11 [Cebus imitator]|uniref:C-type lectin domain family 17, member A isoform X12 n=1 Tax=Cebus imitator TaxID=2715852 RepID=UPI000809A42D|nr:C-type lectin domain family 17, member A isoform X12 [Cebus imitator]XP_037591396.1 C-type lectin domain family 17, member A isoform X11 [Cebus imitator]